MTSEGAQWLAGVRVGVLSAETLYGRARAEQAVVVMSPATASRGLLLCGLCDIAALEDFVGRPIYLDVMMPAGEYLVLDGERLAKSTV